jgi:hypothetical protein
MGTGQLRLYAKEASRCDYPCKIRLQLTFFFDTLLIVARSTCCVAGSGGVRCLLNVRNLSVDCLGLDCILVESIAVISC